MKSSPSPSVADGKRKGRKKGPPSVATEKAEPEAAAQQAPEAVQAEALAEKVESLEAGRIDLLNRLTRAQADLANLKRRSEQEAAEVRKFANQIFAEEILRAVDSLDRALASIPHNLQGFTWIDGLALARAQFDAIFRSQGIRPIEALGKEFDPRQHEAVMGTAEDDAVVLEVLQQGYLLHDRVLRAALVRVGSAPVEESAKREGEIGASTGPIPEGASETEGPAPGPERTGT